MTSGSGIVLVSDPKALVAATTVLLSGIGAGIWFIIKAFFKNNSVRRAISGIADPPSENEKAFGNSYRPQEGRSSDELTRVLIDFVKRSEEDRQKDREDRNRQWEHIDAMSRAIQNQSEATREIATAVQALTAEAKNSSQAHQQAIQRVENAQAGLAQWVWAQIMAGRQTHEQRGFTERTGA